MKTLLLKIENIVSRAPEVDYGITPPQQFNCNYKPAVQLQVVLLFTSYNYQPAFQLQLPASSSITT